MNNCPSGHLYVTPISPEGRMTENQNILQQRMDGNDGEIEWGEIRMMTGDDAKTPSCCPSCMQPGTNPAKILQYDFDSSGEETAAYGVLGVLLKVCVAGLPSKSVLSVKICDKCRNSWLVFKLLEYFFRIGGIVMLFVLLTIFSTPERPLIKRSWEWWILTILPIPLGILLGSLCRKAADRCKGIVFVKHDAGQWFKVRHPAWRREHLSAGPDTKS
jgi:hypothetical protein